MNRIARIVIVVAAVLMLAVFATQLGAPPMVRAQAGCTIADLRGVYGYQYSGWAAPAPGAALLPYAETGKLVVDANGALNATAAVSFGGQQFTWTSTGTAQVNADCTGSSTATNSFGQTATYKFVILEGNKDFLIQGTVLGAVVQGRGLRLKQ